ncbi:alpha/beta hydrolase [Clavibacter michiganensis]|uniref:alpha/beta hydrolase n=1 Tax=Clavibacter michiganensis TaxID=28447 RepID=UPI000D52BC6E|nr:alpha/beta hydrolase [Clavibacter michiganensis]
MTTRVRALLTASAIACALVGALVAPAAPAVAATRPPAVLAGPDAADPTTGAHLPSPARVVQQLRDEDVSDRALRDTAPVALLGALPALDVPELRRLARAIPATIRDLIRRPPSVSGVAAWWSGLAQAERLELAEGIPELVGNLEGIPVIERDAANRRLLDQRERELHARAATTPGRGAQQELGRDMDMLVEVRRALEPAAGGPARSLLTLDTTWPGRAGVVLGDLDTAAYVSIVVPGMFYSVTDRLVDWTDVAARLQQQQTTLLGAGAGAGGVATIAWIGYRTPDLLGIGSLDLAHEGAQYLEGAIQGIQGLRRDDPPYLTVIAHSYGSTAALLALSSGRASVDALAMVGSPGGAVRDAGELDVPAGRVFVGEAPGGPVIGSSYFGSDPGSASFGAEHFGVGGTGAASGVSADGSLAGVVGHNSYFDRGTESFRNLALIGIDRRAVRDILADASAQ